MITPAEYINRAMSKFVDDYVEEVAQHLEVQMKQLGDTWDSETAKFVIQELRDHKHRKGW